MANAVRARGIDAVTFNFLYSEARKRAPDKNDVLEATWEAAIAAVLAREGVGPGSRSGLFIGGKSMGGRIATQVAARRDDLAGVVLLGYPLHPPGKPQQLRVAHLPQVRAPMLFVQGSKDPFGSPDELRSRIPQLSEPRRGSRLVVVEGGDHSLAPRKRSGQTLEQSLARVADEVAAFISSR
jgi:predicted alpha/beta-hydrolase family hydrolase